MRKLRKKYCIIILFSFILLMGCSRNKIEGYYNNIKWDTSSENVREKLNGCSTIINDDDNNITEIIDDFLGIENIEVWLTYQFDDDKLIKIWSTPAIAINDFDVTDDEINILLLNKFIDKYGEYDEENELGYIWYTKYSIISLTNSNKIKYEKID